MKNKIRGGLEGIIAIIILAGLVVALIIAVILPSARYAVDIGDTGKGTLSDLKDTIS